MKKFFWLVSVWSILFMGTMAHADLYDNVKPTNSNKKFPDQTYLLETDTYDTRIYEFTPKSNDNYICIISDGIGGKNATLFCIPKKFQ